MTTATRSRPVGNRRSGRAAALAAATPAGRDRYADLLRVVALGVVIVGHWLQAVLLADGAGGTRVTTLLSEVPAVRPLTWVVQVMPLFFLVGGFTNAASWRSAVRRGEPWHVWMATRAARLLRPALVLLGVWVAVAGALLAGGVEEPILRAALANVVLPLWFLVVHLGATALTPATGRLTARLGWGAPVLLTAAAMAVDAVALRSPGVGLVNVALVWLAVVSLGSLWHQGRLRLDARHGVVLLVVGAAGLAALVAGLGYPQSMVTVDATSRSNAFPPTAALIALGVGQAGVAGLLRGPAERLLARPCAWAVVAVAGSRSMTAYLWHLTAMLLVAGAVLVVGAPDTAVDAGWWAARPLWIAACAAVLAPLLALLHQVERGPVRTPTSAAPVAAGTALAVAGLGAVVLAAITPTWPVAVPLWGLASLLVGARAVGVRARATDPPR